MSPSSLAVGFIPRALPPVDAAQITPAPVLPLGTTPNAGLFSCALSHGGRAPAPLRIFTHYAEYSVVSNHR